ncbi:hypothetical protein [Nocardioides sp. J54]|uniref:hypothetical protein n=1 Tax=Nocardioides sp. J54 TaxID=935866 RepID=UPI00048F2BAB|nr:hypothetical protein [Nocardioides sp. J54]
MSTPPDRDLLEAIRRNDDRNALASRAYEALSKTGSRADHRLLVYRCKQRGCLLLDVIQLPQGVVLHRPAYRRSPQRNEATSNAVGRAKNTTDGDRRWKANTAFASSWGNAELVCDHIHDVVLEIEEIQAAVDAGHTEIRVAADGQRHAVR